MDEVGDARGVGRIDQTLCRGDIVGDEGFGLGAADLRVSNDQRIGTGEQRPASRRRERGRPRSRLMSG